jgi:pseudouridine synthase
LDFLSEGLLVLSPNGHLIFSLTHPKFKTAKSYLVGLSKPLTPKQISQAASGTMVIDDYKLNPVKIEPINLAKFKYLNLETRLFWYQFSLSEGRNRQIRKMASTFGNCVLRLIRVQHGPFRITPEIVKRGYLLTSLAKASQEN